MSHDTARFLFSAALSQWATANNVWVDYDNVKTVNPDDPTGPPVTPRIASHIIPADTYSDTLSGDHECYIGMFQMSIYTKFATGTLENERLVKELKSIFKNNRRFISGKGTPSEITVQVVSPLRVNQGKQEGAEWVVHTDFEYRSDINVDITQEDFEYGIPSS